MGAESTEKLRAEDRTRLLDAYTAAMKRKSYAAAVSAAKAIAELDGVAKPSSKATPTPKTLGELKEWIRELNGMVAEMERAEEEQASLTAVPDPLGEAEA